MKKLSYYLANLISKIFLLKYSNLCSPFKFLKIHV